MGAGRVRAWLSDELTGHLEFDRTTVKPVREPGHSGGLGVNFHDRPPVCS
jgi:hypothetical protein